MQLACDRIVHDLGESCAAQSAVQFWSSFFVCVRQTRKMGSYAGPLRTVQDIGIIARMNLLDSLENALSRIKQKNVVIEIVIVAIFGHAFLASQQWSNRM